MNHLISEREIFKTALDEADALILNPTGNSQEVIDIRTTNLNTLINKFKYIKTDVTEVYTKYGELTALLRTYDAKPLDYPSVENGPLIKTSFNTQIIALNNLLESCKLDNASFNKEDFNTAFNVIKTEIIRLYDLLFLQMNAVAIDTSLLEALIVDVNTFITDTPVGTQVNQCPVVYIEALELVLAEAVSMVETASSQTIIDAKYDELSDLLASTKNKVVKSLFSGYTDENGVFYGPVAPTNGSLWVPAVVIDGVYISPEPMPEQLVSSKVAVESIIGLYVKESDVVLTAFDKPDYLTKNVVFGGAQVSKTFNTMSVFAENVDTTLVSNIYTQFEEYFTTKMGIKIPQISDEMYCDAFKEYHVGEEGSIFPITGYYLVLNSAFADFIPGSDELEANFKCVGIRYVD